MISRLRGDWVLVELEPEPKERTTAAGVIQLGPNPVRIARVLMVGPGKRYRDRYVPTQVKPGDRFPFFKAASDTRQGRQLAERLPDGQDLVHESDILFIIEEGDVEITV